MHDLPYRKLQDELFSKISSNTANLTIVPISSDYTKSGLCLTTVVFPPRELRSKIDNIFIRPLREIEPAHHYYPAGSFHITVKNIRTVNNPPLFSAGDIKKVGNLYGRIIPSLESWDYELDGLIRLPTSVSVKGYSSAYLTHVVQTLHKGLIEAGVPDNKTYGSDSVFFGNLTICRFTSEPSMKFLDKLQELSTINIGSLKVEKLSLINCDAVCSEPSLKIINSYNLKP